MNILFLGNGFDLAHNLPTKYINFLNTVEYISTHDFLETTTIGNIFMDAHFDSCDHGIKESYNKYKTIYDSITIDAPTLNHLKSLNSNFWYKYLSKALKSDVNWIDFEKEIHNVIQSFHSFFALRIGTSVSLSKLGIGNKYIIEQFNFFLNPNNSSILPAGARPVKDEFLIETPIGSQNKTIDKSKIITELSRQLNDLADGLKTYLTFFVEKMVERIPNTQMLQWKHAFQYTDYVLTFNYTNTYEILYKNADIAHIHGNVNSNIVLGVNPDESDLIETIDTTFISFKKYFQRIKYKTDIEYLDLIENNKHTHDISIYVIGHSLNITDRDIIQEIFISASKIFILSYDEIDEYNHISNLLNIFGKNEFDNMRRKKDITFLKISDDLQAIMKKNSKEESLRMMSDLIRRI